MLSVILISLFLGRAAVPVASAASLSKASGHMSQVSFLTCTSNHCFKIQSPDVSEGFLVRGLSFSQSNISYSDKKTGKLLVFNAKNIFYDYYSNRMYIEGINGDDKNEALYEVATGKLKRF